jgi:flagellar biosynthesis protein FlhB
VAEERDDSQRTEEPTQRRLDEAHKKGDIVKSNELSSFIMLAGGTTGIALFSSLSVKRFTGEFRVFLENPAGMTLDSASAALLLQHAIFGLFAIMAPVIGLLLLAGLGGHLIQHRPVFSTSRVKPDLSRLSLAQGFKRLFGLDGIVNLIKGIAKIILVGTAAFWALWPERSRVATALDLNPAGVASLSLSLLIRVLIAALTAYAVIAALDYLYQRQRFMVRQRMTRQELKDEVKQSEGDPQVKARIRQIRFERSRKRMIAAIPEATVVIANPTHYAVALKYESGKMGAPVCVAKGVDHLAQTIRKVAEEHDVPVVENPPLARALYAAVEVDDEIPPAHYKAVAQIIGYVMRLAGQRKFWAN